MEKERPDFRLDHFVPFAKTDLSEEEREDIKARSAKKKCWSLLELTANTNQRLAYITNLAKRGIIPRKDALDSPYAFDRALVQRWMTLNNLSVKETWPTLKTDYVKLTPHIKH